MTQLVRRLFDADAARRLAAEGIAPPLARALAARGITSTRDLELPARDLIPPQQLSHVAAAAKLLADRIDAGASLLIVADYDCDGATACAGCARWGPASTTWCPIDSITATA